MTPAGRMPRCALVVLLLAVGHLAGCAGAGWLAATLAPPRKVQAAYEMPRNQTVLVFVDDILNPLHYQPIKGELTRRLNAELQRQGLARRTIKYERIVDLMAATPQFDKLSVAEIGRKLGADLVLYVHIDRFSLKDDEVSALWEGRIHTTVRVVDVTEGLLWPKTPPEGYALPPVETPATIDTSSTYASTLTEDLADRMSRRIAKLFYKHDEPYETSWGAEPPPSPWDRFE